MKKSSLTLSTANIQIHASLVLNMKHKIVEQLMWYIEMKEDHRQCNQFDLLDTASNSQVLRLSA